MQEVPAIKTTSSDPFEQLRSAALVDTSSQARAFSDFMGLLGRSGQDKAPYTPQTARSEASLYADSAQPQAPASVSVSAQAVAPVLRVDTPSGETLRVAVDSSGASAPNPLVQGTTAAQVNTLARQQSSNSGAASASTGTAGSDSKLSSAKNAPVSREAFEEMRPVLAKAGLSEKDIQDLAARVQAGALTWGKLVQTVAGQMSGAKKPVELSTEQVQGMQALFQKLGFDADQSKGMVADVAKGDGLKVLSNIQQKLASLPDSMSLNLDKQELQGLFKALRLPQDASSKLAQLMGGDQTVADLKNALSQLGQAMQEQHSKNNAFDTDIAKAMGRIMEKDVAKAARDASQSTGQAQTDSSSPRLTFEVKTKDRNDTSWFDQHEKKQGQSKPEDGSWRDFLNKVRPEGDAMAQARAATQTAGKDSLDALSARGTFLQGAQQGKADIAQQAAKPFDKVAAPKMLDQVQEALLKDLGQGRKQLTLNLDPESLGKLQVMLQVKDKDVRAVLRAEDPETAKLLTAQMDSIKKTLEDQGLKVQQLEVQTGLSGGAGQQAQFSADQHNQAQERQELSRIFSQLRMLRTDGGDAAGDVQSQGAQAILAERGLHIVA